MDLVAVCSEPGLRNNFRNSASEPVHSRMFVRKPCSNPYLGTCSWAAHHNRSRLVQYLCCRKNFYVFLFTIWQCTLYKHLPWQRHLHQKKTVTSGSGRDSWEEWRHKGQKAKRAEGENVHRQCIDLNPVTLLHTRLLAWLSLAAKPTLFQPCARGNLLSSLCNSGQAWKPDFSNFANLGNPLLNFSKGSECLGPSAWKPWEPESRLALWPASLCLAACREPQDILH